MSTQVLNIPDLGEAEDVEVIEMIGGGFNMVYLNPVG